MAEPAAAQGATIEGGGDGGDGDGDTVVVGIRCMRYVSTGLRRW